MTAWTQIARRLLLERHAELWLGMLDRSWSLTDIRARVVGIRHETPDVRTLLLEPNRHWRQHRAGQFTCVEVEIDGVRVQRCYSISSPPRARELALTVKRVSGGNVSTHLHRNVRVGDVLRLGPATGEFVLPERVPGQLLFLSGGSGITPVMSILRDLAERDAIEDVVFVHHARSAADVIFREELLELARRHNRLRVLLGLSDDPAGTGRFDEARLVSLVPDLFSRDTFVCGPPGLTDRVERMWADAGASALLRREQFQATVPAGLPAGNSTGTVFNIRLARSAHSVSATGGGTLLEQLEGAGERPRSGCRIGICKSCKCQKVSGVVQNLLTGAISSQPNQEIQLCISLPRSDLELGL